MGGGGQDGCERRIEVFVKIHKKKQIRGWGVGWGGGSGGAVGLVGGQGGCERKIDFFGGGRVGGVRVDRVDVNEEMKFWGKFTKKNSGGGSGVGVGLVGVRVDVNAMLGGRG